MNYKQIYAALIEKARKTNIDGKFQLHHILPRHQLGNDDSGNIVKLTFKEHIFAHRCLWKIYKHIEDKVAYSMMKGVGSDERQRLIASLGGSVQGKRNAESGWMKSIYHMGASKGGKQSAIICREQQVNSFFNEELHKVACTQGGKVQGQRNKESGHLKRIAQLPNNRSKGMVWITNGSVSKMIYSTETLPDGWKYGRSKTK